MKKGDVIASVAQPIAKVSDYFLGTDLQNCGGCKKMQDNLNAGTPLWEALRDRFWLRTETNNMQYILNVQVEAETVEDAIKSKDNWKIISVNPRPEPRPQPVTQIPGRQVVFPPGAVPGRPTA
jgi:hypothetical protein